MYLPRLMPHSNCYRGIIGIMRTVVKAFLRFSVLGISRRRPVSARVYIYNGPQNTTFRLGKDHLGKLSLVFAWYLHVMSIENVSKHY